MKIFQLESTHTDAVAGKLAKLHVEAFPVFFLSQMGEKFLTVVYKGYLEDSGSGIMVAEEEGRIVGFIAWSNAYSDFYRKLLHRHFIYLGWRAFLALLKHPSFLKKLLSALKKSEEVKREEPYVELASICVAPACEKRGIGSRLINEFVEIVDFSRYAYIKLETDAKDNERVNTFYRKCGFELARTYVTPEGRKMNEYHYHR